MNALERNITLALIDDAWKSHLRAMDDLRHSVQTAGYEQKDPLVIYKIEAFNAFKEMNDRVNKEIVSFLCQGSRLSFSFLYIFHIQLLVHGIRA